MNKMREMEDIFKKCGFNRVVEKDTRPRKEKEWGARYGAETIFSRGMAAKTERGSKA